MDSFYDRESLGYRRYFKESILSSKEQSPIFEEVGFGSTLYSMVKVGGVKV